MINSFLKMATKHIFIKIIKRCMFVMFILKIPKDSKMQIAGGEGGVHRKFSLLGRKEGNKMC